MASRVGTPRFLNCTFAENTAKIGNGGALYDHRGKAIIRNCILWNNRCDRYGSHEIFNRYDSTTVTHSDVKGGWPGTGNIDARPLFVNTSAHDYRIQDASPCRDAGHNADLPPDEADLGWGGNTTLPVPNDLDFKPRVSGNAVDMGAYEWTPVGQ